MPMRRGGWFVALGVLLVAGCGGKGSSTASPTTTITASGSPSTTVPAFAGSRNSKYCDLARQFSQAINLNLSKDPKVAFQQFDSLSGQYLAVVPSDIKADAGTIVKAGKQLEAVFAAANYDATKIKASDLAALQDPKLIAAAQRINAYNNQVCGIAPPTT